MTIKLRQIEVEAATADALEARAAEQGISVSELLADLVVTEGSTGFAEENEQVAELDRRWAKVEAGERTVANDEVVRWLETWGTPDYKPWSSR
jgi:predicted transcriptional regulator